MLCITSQQVRNIQSLRLQRFTLFDGIRLNEVEKGERRQNLNLTRKDLVFAQRGYVHLSQAAEDTLLRCELESLFFRSDSCCLFS